MPRPTVVLTGDDFAIPRPSPGRDWLASATHDSLERFRLDFDRAYYGALRAFRDQGFYVVGEVAIRDSARRDILASFIGSTPSLLVRLYCDLEVLKEREVRRGDRVVGLAEESSACEVAELPFDLQFDTGRMSPDEVASDVVAAVTGSSAT